MPNKQYRVEKVEQEIQRIVTEYIIKKLRDKRLTVATITGVKLTGDLQNATVYYSLLSDKASDHKKAALAFEKAKGLIRSEVGKKLSTYKTPTIDFEEDKSIQYGNHIDELISELHKSENE